MSNANDDGPDKNFDYSENAENSLVFRQVAPGSKRRRNYVRAYRNWVQFTTSP